VAGRRAIVKNHTESDGRWSKQRLYILKSTAGSWFEDLDQSMHIVAGTVPVFTPPYEAESAVTTSGKEGDLDVPTNLPEEGWTCLLIAHTIPYETESTLRL
jgi:hypothetical protein